MIVPLLAGAAKTIDANTKSMDTLITVIGRKGFS